MDGPVRHRPVLAALVLAALVLPGLAQAQDDGGASPAAGDRAETVPGPGLTVLLWHPCPDDADKLGFPFQDGRDGYWARYQHLDTDRDGFDFPHMVTDGIVASEGLPDPGAPYASTRAAYEDAVAARSAQDPPVALELSAAPAEAARGFGGGGDCRGQEDGDGAADETAAASPVRIDATVAVLPRGTLDGESLHLWVALVEDHVHYAPPPRVSNGVTDHRFTVRAAQDLGVLDLSRGVPAIHNASLAAPEDAPLDQLYVAAWLQQGGSHGLRFDPHEVVQATIHRVQEPGVTRQADKGVLMEVYSATWCDPCLFGDQVAEELAAEYGLQTVDPERVRTSYLRAPPSWTVFALAAVAGAAVLGASRLPGGRP